VAPGVPLRHGLSANRARCLQSLAAPRKPSFRLDSRAFQPSHFTADIDNGYRPGAGASIRCHELRGIRAFDYACLLRPNQFQIRSIFEAE
jgi:hypothetical protein